MSSQRLIRPFSFAVRTAAFSSQRPLINSRKFHSTPINKAVTNITSVAEFRNVINDSKKNKVLVDCFATWCGPCKAIAPIISKLSEEVEFEDDIVFAKFDVDQLPELTQELGVTAMPTFFFFKNGESVGQLKGADPAGLINMLREHK